MLTILNEGPFIVSTNYWSTEYARRGYAYLSVNARAFRLLLPPVMVRAVDEMRTAEYVIVTRGTWYADRPRVDAMELLFEDHSDSPYSIHLSREQVDRHPPKEDHGRTDLRFLAYAWDEAAKGSVVVLDLPARYRIAQLLPCLKPW